MSTVKIEHELLDSKNATFVALVNEVLKWGEANGLTPSQITCFMEGFKVTPAEAAIRDVKKQA